jgi:hypothetical protein
LLISIDGGQSWVSAAVLTFTKDNWDTAQQVMVRAAHDDAVEGERLVQISHSISVASESSADLETFRSENVLIPNLTVRLLDDDLGGLLVLESGAGTRVLEGDILSAIIDTYQVKLPVAPTTDVTVSLIHDGQVTIYDELGNPVSELIFTTGNWNIWQTLTVKAVDDAIRENSLISKIIHTFDSDDPVYDGAPAAELDVKVLDDDSARVLVTESDGSTSLVKGISGDDYSLRLTSEPAGEVTVNLFADSQVNILIGGRVFLNNIGPVLTLDLQFADNGDADTITRLDGNDWENDGYKIGSLISIGGITNNGTFKINDIDGSVLTLTAGDELTTGTENVTVQRMVHTVTFDHTNWYEEVTVQVEADENFTPVPGSQFIHHEPIREHTVDQIRGPLIIEGGIAEGKDRSLRTAVMLPYESTATPIPVDVLTDETERADTIRVFNDSSTSDDSGLLSWQYLRNDIVKLGDPDNGIDPVNLSGLGMGDGLVVDISNAQDGSNLITFPGGITFDDIEVTEILLGKGNDVFEIEATSAGTFGAEDYVITVVHGGGNTAITEPGS